MGFLWWTSLPVASSTCRNRMIWQISNISAWLISVFLILIRSKSVIYLFVNPELLYLWKRYLSNLLYFFSTISIKFLSLFPSHAISMYSISEFTLYYCCTFTWCCPFLFSFSMMSKGKSKSAWKSAWFFSETPLLYTSLHQFFSQNKYYFSSWFCCESWMTLS